MTETAAGPAPGGLFRAARCRGRVTIRRMKAHVYRSAKRDDTYVYLRDADAFGVLPPELLQRLGLLTKVMEVDLVPGRKLARVDPAVVREHLATVGYHLQLPPVPEDLLRR